MSLAQKLFDITPDWLRVRMFELTDEEKFFLDVVKEKRMLIRGYICSDEPERTDIIECRYIMKTMKFLLDKYGKDGRFYKYFVGEAESLEQDFKCLLGYR